MFDNDGLYYWQSLVCSISEIESQEKEETLEGHKMIFILQKDNSSKIIRDFIYDMAPTTYYDHGGIIRIDEYQLVEVKDGKAYYKFIKPKQAGDVA